MPQNPPTKLNAETLLNLGFVDVANWSVSEKGLGYLLDGPNATTNQLRLNERNALYAFVEGENVLYIGKTARTIRERFTGYCRPALQQKTNWRCNGKIREASEQGREIRIFVFTPISQLRYGLFDLNIAAGLEDSLIASFDPPWNGRERGMPVSEEAEREKAEEPVMAASEPSPQDIRGEVILGRFQIKLGEAYYDQGLINPGTAASERLGDHGDPIEVFFQDGTEPVQSAINRTANKNGSVRLVGRNAQIASWFQKHFAKGDIVHAEILGPNRILLHMPKAG